MKLKGIPCPKCGRKGLHHPDHPHAFGFKEYGKARCRFCYARFNLKERSTSNKANTPDQIKPESDEYLEGIMRKEDD